MVGPLSAFLLTILVGSRSQVVPLRLAVQLKSIIADFGFSADKTLPAIKYYVIKVSVFPKRHLYPVLRNKHIFRLFKFAPTCNRINYRKEDAV